MQVLIRAKRIVEYCSIVEMPEEEFKRLHAGWDSDERKEREEAEKKIDNWIDTHDWVDDEPHEIEEFEEYVAPKIS